MICLTINNNAKRLGVLVGGEGEVSLGESD